MQLSSAQIRLVGFIRVLAVLRREGGVRQPERFGAFVNSVCKNVLREYYRAYYKDRPLEEGHLDIPDKVIDLERSLINQETNSPVRGILEELSPTDRNLLRAVFLEEGDKDEICRRFGVDRDYLRVRLHRAKERFRTLFQKDLALPRRAAAKESSSRPTRGWTASRRPALSSASPAPSPARTWKKCCRTSTCATSSARGPCTSGTTSTARWARTRTRSTA